MLILLTELLTMCLVSGIVECPTSKIWRPLVCRREKLACSSKYIGKYLPVSHKQTTASRYPWSEIQIAHLVSKLDSVS